MLAAFCTNNNDTTSVKLLGLTSQNQSTMHFISFSNNNNGFISGSNCSGTDTCSFYSGPSDETILAFGESCGSIASSGGESCGSIAFSGGGESCGSIASSSSGSFSGGGCSYSC